MDPEVSDAGALDVDSAVALLTTPDEQDQPQQQSAQDAPAADQEIEAATSAADETAQEPEQPEGGEAEQEQEQAETRLEAPLYWKPEAKAKFAQLDPELQAEILAQEGPREEVTAKAKAEAKAQAEAAQQEMASIQKLAESLNSFLPEAVQTFKSRWGEGQPDWEKVAEEHGTDAAFRLKTQYEKEQSQLVQLCQANEQAQIEANTAFVRSEWKVLAEIAPDLAPDVSDVKKGAESRQAVTSYLLNQGIGRDAVQLISAREMLIAHKAMLWDQAQAALKAKPATPKPAAPAPKAASRPTAAQPHVPAKVAAAEAAKRSFQKTGSIDDAVAYLTSRG